MNPMYTWDGEKGPGHFHYVRNGIETPRKDSRKLDKPEDVPQKCGDWPHDNET